MRLQVLETGHRPAQKALLDLIRAKSEGQVPGPILVMTYRRELFGKYLASCFQEGMRGATEWSVGELELFAAFVSRLIGCKYCVGDHAAAAALGMGNGRVVAAVLKDWRTAPVNEKVKLTLGLLEKVTRSPAELRSADIAPLRAAGVSEQGIREALYVCFLFNVMGRLADAFDFPLPSARGFKQHGRFLYTRGYGMSSIPDEVPGGGGRLRAP